MDTKTAAGPCSSDSAGSAVPAGRTVLPPITVRDLYAEIGEREVVITQQNRLIQALSAQVIALSAPAKDPQAAPPAPGSATPEGLPEPPA